MKAVRRVLRGNTVLRGCTALAPRGAARTGAYNATQRSAVDGVSGLSLQRLARAGEGTHWWTDRVALVALALGGAGMAAWRLHVAASVSPAAEVAPGLRPTPARSFYNRERELQYVQAKLSAEPTSVTLIVGPENSGKTGEQQRYRVELNLLLRTLQFLNASRS